MNTRSYPRTMQECWGPYTSNELHPMPDAPMDWQDKVVMVGSAIVGLVFLGVVLL